MGTLITDLLESNANALLAEFRVKLAKLNDVHSSVEPGGDFHETVSRQNDTLTDVKPNRKWSKGGE